MCESSGRWSSSIPVCDPVDCGDPGSVQMGVRELLVGTTLGSTTIFKCDPGYLLEGSATRRCQANGRWSGSVPRCVCECVVLHPVRIFAFVTRESFCTIKTPLGALSDAECIQTSAFPNGFWFESQVHVWYIGHSQCRVLSPILLLVGISGLYIIHCGPNKLIYHFEPHRYSSI